MRSSPRPHARRRATGLAGLLATLFLAPPGEWARAQDPAKGLFDDDKPAAKEAEGKDKDAAKKPDRPAVPAGDTIGFTQENAAAQMTELEERMFRLSEALRGLEPENASRLRLALKFSREELILEQMRDAHKMLKGAQLSKAETEIKELLAKLEHLRNVLLAEDLDFQLKLARLRQMRETLGQLERIVKDERRELGWSRFAIDQRRSGEKLAARRPDLESLARDQKRLLDDTRALAAKKDGDHKAARAALRDREAAITKATTALAGDPVFADYQPSQLRKAEVPLKEAAEELGQAGKDLAGAVAPEEKAEAILREELKSLDGRSAAATRDLAKGEFGKHEAGQQTTRKAAEALAAASARLGDAGVALQKDLIRAGGSMQDAEKNLAKTAADPAASEQSEALDILTRSGEELAKATEKLLVQLRTELYTRLIAELTEMHEAQAYIRENTEAQAPMLAKKSRPASIAMAGLAQKEGELAGRTEQLLALVEETEFGIALPTALKVFGREMREVEGRLKETDASPQTVAMEKRIEEDLLGLLQAVRRLPPTTPPPANAPLPSDLSERERELNRLIAELKTIRLLQARLNDDTVGVDKTRTAPVPAPSATLTPALRREIEALEATQEDLRENLARIAERIEQP
ncbi:DUF4175 domain-containing protein [Aquisphaera insulae]|uniref:DUF4175 domain-containing protein n=1 Tax=Aquisphaera insulae TaxID=2712864 RepID=UPI0013ED99FF|nr:DUF4175 domain-containing protein [Aquisphaera insulae]